MNDEHRSRLMSILIPTYNRVKFLETTVDCFINQINKAGLEKSTEIIISNDASKDTTNSYVDNISSKHSFITGYNQPINLGLSGNIEFLVEKATGKYILICGEDDLMRDDALGYFVKCIQEKDPNFILINTSNIISNDDSNKDFKIILENRLEINDNIFIDNFEKDHNKLDKAKDWLHLTNLLPAVIFRKDLFQKELLSAKKYLRPENLWLWQAPIIIGISNYGRLLVIAECFVLHRKNESHWTNSSGGVTFFNIFDNAEIAKLVKVYMPTEYKKYKKLYASFIMGGLLLATHNRKNVRGLAWNAFTKNVDCFPENIQFLSMVLFPKITNKISHELRKFKRYVR